MTEIIIDALEVIIMHGVLDLADIFTCFCLSKTILDAMVNSDSIKNVLKHISEKRGLNLCHQQDEDWIRVISTCRGFRRIAQSQPKITTTTFATELISCHMQVNCTICILMDTLNVILLLFIAALSAVHAYDKTFEGLQEKSNRKGI